jgi:hypothetical protein
LDAGQLTTRATADHPDYVRATPFPHVVWDDFFPTDLLDEVLSEFPGRDAIRWGSFGIGAIPNEDPGPGDVEALWTEYASWLDRLLADLVSRGIPLVLLHRSGPD